MKKHILVGQSGGPTAVINASLYGVIREGMAHPDEIDHVYGMAKGMEGFLSGGVENLPTVFPGNSWNCLSSRPRPI